MKRHNKICKSIICLLIAVTVLIPNTTTVKAWFGSDHQLFMQDAVSSDGITNMSQKELNLLYKCSQLPDDARFRIYDTNNPGDTVSALHGRKNYIIALKYVYEIAFEYLQNEKAESKIGDTIDQYNNKYPKLKNVNYIIRIDSSLKKLLEYDVLNGKDQMSTYEASNRKKAIKVMGFACHLVGDIFAHMAIVPDTNSFTQSMFTTSSDKTYSARIKFKKFKKIIDEYEIPFADLSKLTFYGEDFRDHTKGNQKLVNNPEFSESLLNSISGDLKSDLYEDNKDFYSFRSNATKVILNNVLLKFSSALAARDAGTYYSKVFDINTLDAYQNKLKHYSGYKQEAIANMP